MASSEILVAHNFAEDQLQTWKESSVGRWGLCFFTVRHPIGRDVFFVFAGKFRLRMGRTVVAAV